MYAITGSTGNTGMVVAEELLKSGKEVIAIGRNEEKLAQLESANAEIRAGDLQDKDFAVEAFKGARAAYVMIPPNYRSDDYRRYYRELTESMADAVLANGLIHVVTLSSIGANLPEKAGIVQGLYDMEQIFNGLEGVNVLHLRAGFFMENLFSLIPVIKNSDILPSGIRADLAVPLVATPDIGIVAARRLKALNFTGKSHQYVLGARDYTYPQIASKLGRYIRKPGLKYVQINREEIIQSFLQMGASRNVGELYAEFIDSMNKGLVMNGVVRNARNTTPTLLNEFAVFFAEAYKSGRE